MRESILWAFVQSLAISATLAVAKCLSAMI